MAKRICYTYGVFDLFHVGHLRVLEEAKKLGDYLIVGVFTDEVSKSFKRQPITPLWQRLLILQALRVVDEVEVLYKLLPDLEGRDIQIVAKAEGAGWNKDYIPQWKGIKSVLLDYTKGVSTTDIIKQCKNI